jgi:hypothetical protein
MGRKTSSPLGNDRKVARTADLDLDNSLSLIPKDVSNNKMTRSALQ